MCVRVRIQGATLDKLSRWQLLDWLTRVYSNYLPPDCDVAIWLTFESTQFHLFSIYAISKMYRIYMYSTHAYMNICCTGHPASSENHNYNQEHTHTCRLNKLQESELMENIYRYTV